MRTPTERARWRRSQIAETVASSHVSAPCYGTPEDVRIVPIVESETELREIQRQIFLANVVVGADDPALQERPERIDILSCAYWPEPCETVPCAFPVSSDPAAATALTHRNRDP